MQFGSSLTVAGRSQDPLRHLYSTLPNLAPASCLYHSRPKYDVHALSCDSHVQMTSLRDIPSC